MPYRTLKRIVGPALRHMWRVRPSGLANIPADGPAILASNHVSICDFVFLGLVSDREITFGIKSEAFTAGGPGGRVLRAMLGALGQLSVDRTPGVGAQRALAASTDILERGELFCLYPEGTRSPDGRLYRGRTGIGWLALSSKAPVIPVGMVGTDRILGSGQLVPRLGRIAEVRIGAQVDLSEYEGMADDAKARRAATDLIMAEIGTLTGQEYADVYASTMKKQKR